MYKSDKPTDNCLQQQNHDKFYLILKSVWIISLSTVQIPALYYNKEFLWY